MARCLPILLARRAAAVGFVACLACVALAACTNEPASSGATADAGGGAFPVEAYASAVSEDGALHVAVRTNPQPPPRGTCAAEVTITDESGAPRDGLDLAVVPWMPAMGHGSSIHPDVTAEGSGRYLISNVNLFMPGEWELRVSFTGPVTTNATPVLTVP